MINFGLHLYKYSTRKLKLKNCKPNISSPGDSEMTTGTKIFSSGGKPLSQRKVNGRGKQPIDMTSKARPGSRKSGQGTRISSKQSARRAEKNRNNVKDQNLAENGQNDEIVYKRRLQMLQMVDDEEGRIMLNQGNSTTLLLTIGFYLLFM